ncbi:MAG: hypothetical protein EP344_05540 [Bacteroidetes bacterium]|nr:MAG: hypothetical protein EP344_05540 [Bacteroidota bacterium]
MAAKGKGKPTPKIKRSKTQSAPASAPARKKVAEGLTSTFQAGFWKQHWIPALILMAIAFGLYAAALRFGYILDDQMVYWQNAYVQKGFAGIREIFGSDSFMGYFQKRENLMLLEGGRYRPLSLATFAMEVGIFGKDHPGLSHLINILLYGFTGILLYRILLGLFPLKENGRWYFSVAFIGALLFVVHPLHSEAVANIKGRDEILALLFSLAALYAALKYFDTNRAMWNWSAGLFLLLGLFAKENALTFLAVIPFTVWFFTRVPAGRIAASGLPLFLAAFVFIIVRYRALGFMLDHGNAVGDLMNNPFLGMSIGEKFATIFLTLGWYLKLLVWPYPLTHDYYPYHVPKVGWGDWRALLSLAFYLGAGIWALLNIKRRQVSAYAFFYWVLTLSIVSNLFVSVGTFMNERFAYMPSVAFCLLAGWFLAQKLPEWFKEQPNRPYLLGAGLLALVVAAFGYLTVDRVPVWKDALTLNGSAVKVSPNSARSHCFYVTAIYDNVYLKTKEPTEKARWVDTMEYHINRSLEINPDYGSALVMKGAVAAARFEQDHQMDKLFHAFTIVLEKIPNNANFRPFFDKYMAYLATSGGNPNKINAFCYRMGYEYFYKEKNDVRNAVAVLEHALPTQAEDERVLRALAEIYGANGNSAKAAEMNSRAEASANMLIR